MTQRRAGLSLVEVLIAVLVLAALGIPVLELATQNVRALRVDRARCFAEALAGSTLERFGSGHDDVRRWLAPVTEDPWTLTARDLWMRTPRAFDEMGLAAAPRWTASHDMHLTLTLRLDVAPGMDLLVSESTWLRDGGSSGPREKVSHVRALLHPHTH